MGQVSRHLTPRFCILIGSTDSAVLTWAMWIGMPRYSERIVTGHHRLFGGSQYASEAKHCRRITLVHHAVFSQVGIFAMRYYRDIEHGSVLIAFSSMPGSDRLPSSDTATAPANFNSPISASSSPFNPFEIAMDIVNIALFLCFFRYISPLLHVNDRNCVGHTGN